MTRLTILLNRTVIIRDMKENEIESTQECILRAATEIFMQKGFDATKTTEIAKRAGVTHAMLHYYYRTKENLFTIIFEAKLKELAESFISVIDQPVSFEEKIAHAVRTHLDYLSQNPQLPIFIISELHANPERTDRVRKIMGGVMYRVLDKFFKEVKQEVDAGRIREIDPFDLLMTILSLNISIFIISPILPTFNYPGYKSLSDIIGRRREENIQIILKYISK
ncbi:hypothetical protein MASR1M31_24940 [Porphyromonadaceae bacterium]